MAQQKNSDTNFFTDMQSTFKDMFGGVQAQPFDMASAMETGRKNFQAITEANKRAVSGWQALAQRQAEMVSQFVQQNSSIASQGMTEVSPQEKLAQQTQILNDVCQRTMANTQELAAMATQCTKDASEVISKRVVASINEIKAASGKAD